MTKEMLLYYLPSSQKVTPPLKSVQISHGPKYHLIVNKGNNNMKIEPIMYLTSVHFSVYKNLFYCNNLCFFHVCLFCTM